MTGELYNVRAATHRACDRVVFDLNGLGRVGYLGPEFRPAFRAWLASDSAIRSSTTPFEMTEYRLQRAADSDSLHASAVRAQRAAR